MFNFIYPYIPAYADTGSDNIEEAPGGVLLEPLLGLISSIGEGVIWVIQSQLLGLSTSNIYVTNDGNWQMACRLQCYRVNFVMRFKIQKEGNKI